jgi:hypothetical protein
MARKQADRQRIIALFRSIQESFSNLSMIVDTGPGNFDVSLAIPKQSGLAFDVFVNLQGDELHLQAGKYFWLEWFPCTEARVEADFFESLRGLLLGQLRVVEYHSRGKAFKAVLQRRVGGAWKSHGTWARLHGWTWRTRHVVLQNRQEQGSTNP